MTTRYRGRAWRPLGVIGTDDVDIVGHGGLGGTRIARVQPSLELREVVGGPLDVASDLLQHLQGRPFASAQRTALEEVGNLKRRGEGLGKKERREIRY